MKLCIKLFDQVQITGFQLINNLVLITNAKKFLMIIKLHDSNVTNLYW